MGVESSKEISEIPKNKIENSPLGKAVEKKSFDKPKEEYDKPIPSLDDNVKPYALEGKLLPENQYEINGTTYDTDSQGRIFHFEGSPEKLSNNKRDIMAQRKVGGEDQGGHLAAKALGGDGGLGNLVPMDSRINQGDFKRMENTLLKALDEGENVYMSGDLKYDSNSSKPDIIKVLATIDGARTDYTFDNKMSGALNDKVSDLGKKVDVSTVEDGLKEINGLISSVKEEYDKNGDISKTTFTITYVNEDGKNQRIKSVIEHHGGE